MYQNMIDAENKEWDKKMLDLKQHFLQIENEMIEKQKEEYDNSLAGLERSLPAKAKPSSALLNLKQIQQNLVKQKK